MVTLLEILYTQYHFTSCFTYKWCSSTQENYVQNMIYIDAFSDIKDKIKMCMCRHTWFVIEIHTYVVLSAVSAVL